MFILRSLNILWLCPLCRQYWWSCSLEFIPSEGNGPYPWFLSSWVLPHGSLTEKTSINSDKITNIEQICFIALVAYLISRIVILYGPTLRGNTAGKSTILLFAFMSLVFTVGVVVVSIICTMNFNRGLKAVNEHKIQAARDSYMALSERGRSPVPVHSSDLETRGSRYFLD